MDLDCLMNIQKDMVKHIHSEEPLLEAESIFYEKTGQLPNDCYHKATQFPRAMPEEWKFDDSIDTFVAYRRYIASKPWAATNYLRIPDRKPEWL